MHFLVELYHRLRWIITRSRFNSDLADEIQFHIDSRAEELEQSGVPHAVAAARARREFGSRIKAAEEVTFAWRIDWLDALFSDLRYSARSLTRSPAFTCTAVLSLAFGIGANTAIFTAADALLFKPLPVKDPTSVVTFSAPDNRGHTRKYFPFAFCRQLQSSSAFADIIGTNSDGLSFSAGGRAERVMGEVVTPNFFSALGITPALGQGFSSDVAHGKWAAEVVLSYSFWKARFGGDPQVIGRLIRLNTFPFTIVGVSPKSFLDLYQGQDPELRIPFLPSGQEIHQIQLLSADQEVGLIARLAPGVSRPQAEALANSQLLQFVRESTQMRTRGISYGRLHLLSGERGWPELAEDYQSPITVLFLLVFVALLIACANVATMLLARATARRREFAVRSSLGAGRGRLIRQILTESLLLSLFGGLIGLFVTPWVAQILLHFLPQGHIHLVLDLGLDAHSFIFIVALSISAGFLLGLTAAFQSTRGNLIAAVKTDSNSSIGGSATLRKVLVASQIAFSLTLLVVAGLFVRTVFNLNPTSDYPRARSILVFTMKPQREIYSPDRIRTITAEVIRRVSALRGVESAAIAENGPFASREDSVVFQVPGRAGIEVATDDVTPGFLNTIGLRVFEGRDFTPLDKPGSPKVVILSKRLAEALFPHEDAIGRTVELASENPHAAPQSFNVIGIVPDTHYYDARRLAPTAFFTYQNNPPYMPTLHVRVAGDHPDTFISAIRHEFDSVDSGFPVFNVRTLEDRTQDALARERMIADLSSAFGSLALLLAAVGLYGVLAYSVARRTREIGVRIALGSNSVAILWLVLREALALVGLGGICGLFVSVLAGALLANRLYGVPPTDPTTLATATVILLLISVIAASIPALRASRVDPLSALQNE